MRYRRNKLRQKIVDNYSCVLILKPPSYYKPLSDLYVKSTEQIFDFCTQNFGKPIQKKYKYYKCADVAHTMSSWCMFYYGSYSAFAFKEHSDMTACVLSYQDNDFHLIQEVPANLWVNTLPTLNAINQSINNSNI